MLLPYPAQHHRNLLSVLLGSTPKPSFCSPYSCSCLLMSTDDGSADPGILVVSVRCQDLEDLFSNACLSPAAKALVGAFPVAIALRQMTPVGSATQNPQNAVDESPVICGRSASISNFAGQQVLDLLPLRFRELVSPGYIHLTRLPTHKWSGSQPECRFLLIRHCYWAPHAGSHAAATRPRGHLRPTDPTSTAKNHCSDCA
jgi:hypothetical protein